MKVSRCFLPIVVCVVLIGITGCEQESWNLVSPPPNADTIMVRLVNMVEGGTSYVLQLDAITAEARTSAVPPLSASGWIKSPADSAYVRVFDAGGKVLKDAAARTRFNKRTVETMVLLPSTTGAQAADTLVRLVTNPSPLPLPGRAQLRFLCAVPDTTLTYEVRLGCPSGEFFDRQSFRGSGAFRELPAGEIVVSILRGSEPVAIVRQELHSQQFATVIVAGRAPAVRVFLLDELEASPSALREMLPIPEAERTALVRWMNVSQYHFDSIRIASVGVIASNGTGQFLSDYQRVPACSNALSDTVELYANGVRQDAVPISVEVGYRYTIVVLDAPNFGAPASRLAVVVRDRSGIAGDSCQWQVLNATGQGQQITAFLGARLDAAGSYHNGEYLANALGDGVLGPPVRIPVGAVPIIVRGGVPERILALAVDTARAGRLHTLVVLAGRNGSADIYTLSDDAPSGPIAPRPAGAIIQFVNAVADRTALRCRIGNMVDRSSLTPTNVLATVLPAGSHTVTVGNQSVPIQVDPSRVITLIAAGHGQTPSLIVLDSTSLQPTTFVARVRCVNAAPDVQDLRMARDQLTSLDQWDSNIFANRIAFGFASRPIEFPRLQRINLVFGTSGSPPQELLRPDGSVSFALGKAFTVVFYGTRELGYNVFILQEP
ncbi:MAG: hypothetical protein KatS3mg039_0391 [Candidatus Kapaibacterium sp.]|nr:MAG: hypothetical protein KatS3mg039_0391 [Candidatus Kapabacteria bacterium]